MKKLLTLITCVLLLFTLTACSVDLGNGFGASAGGIEQSSNNPTTSSSNNPASSTTPTTSSTNPTTSSNSASSSSKNSTTTSSTNSTKNSTTSSSSTSSSSSSGQSTSTEQPTGEVSSTIKPLSYAGLSESAYVTWTESALSSAKAYYKLSSASSYSNVDQQLIRQDGSGKARVDMVGLKAGEYDLRVHVGGENADIEIKNVKVSAYDRSGYAHFNYTTGVGAYNDDGTLKSGIKVVYINEATKNTNKLVASVQAGNVCIRILGRVCADAWSASGSKEGKYTQISGITDNKLSGDSYFNMVDVSGKSNITVEGIGTDAEAFQWGFTFKNCKNIEVRNLTFTDYPEDACAFEAGQTSTTKVPTHGWVHNCVFNKGKNLYDLTSEQDKGEGDGATDVKKTSYMTYSYNVYNNCHKTGLVGGDDKHYQSDITMHHNYYNKTYSRTPLGRQANLHYYNNFFNDCGSYCVSLRANCYLFSEANYVYSCTFRDSKSGGACKSFNDKFDGASKGSISVVTDRTATVSNSCSYGSTFDTDSSKFYYDSSAKVSKVSYMTTADQAKTDCINSAGVCKANPSK